MSKLIAAPLSPESWPRPLRAAGLGLAWLLLAIYFHSPVREAMTPTLDGSNFGSYAYFTAHRFQYGTEVVPMAGPYGFIMYGRTYTGELAGLRTVGELVLNASLAVLTLWFFRHLRGSALRWAWLAAHVAFTPFIEDLPIEWILVLGGLYLLQAPDPGTGPRPGWRTGLVLALLALVSLIKGTQLILGLATLGVVLGSFAWQRQWRKAGGLAISYVAALLLFWVCAGQNPLHLPAYVRGVVELGGGYTEAMAIPTPPNFFLGAVLVSSVLAALLGWAFWIRRGEVAGTAALCLLAGHTFVQWKHGLVRSDGHAFIYFYYAVVAAPTLYLVAWQGARMRSGPWTPAFGQALLVAALATAMFNRAGDLLPDWEGSARALLPRFRANLASLLHPAEERGRFNQALQLEQQRHALPHVRSVVGSRSIDAFGYEQGLLLLNHFNYHPRPMGGGAFNAYTPYLMKLNRAFVREEARRPDFYLLKPQTIDDRLFAADDGLALVEILQRYHPVLVEQGHLLMADPGPLAAPPRVLSRAAVAWADLVRLPEVPANEMLLLRIALQPAWAGRLAKLFYKPPAMYLEAFDAADRSLGRHRIIPAMASLPFVLSPQLMTLEDLVNLYAPGAGRIATHFRLTHDGPATAGRTVDVEYLAAPRPPALPASRMAEMRGRLEFPVANVLPASATPPFRPHLFVRFLHAPSEIVWNLQGGERTFDFHFGIDAEAYTHGTTNGVDFVVEVRGPSGGTQPVFRRSLRPRENPADRGDQETRVTLPLFAAGSRLVLRTDPGEHGDNAWDWAWVNRIELQSGAPYAPELFPGFNRVPDSVDAENAAALEAEGARVLLLHVPGRVGFTLAGTERKLSLGFGFLPGAYTNGGQTTGADYIVELARAGQPPREIFRRQLRPTSEPADRGAHTGVIDLPAIAAGDVLTLRTAAVPGGNSSWGWTYLSRVVFE